MKKMLFLAFSVLFGGCAMPSPMRQAPEDFLFSTPRSVPRVDYSPDEAGRRVAVVHLDTRLTTESAAAFEVLVKSLIGADEIVVEIDSGGGDTSAAAAIATAILAAPAPVTCVARFAGSAAFMVFQTCPQRYMEADGLLMIHEATYVYPASSDLLNDLTRKATLAEFNRLFANVCCHKMRIGIDECRSRFAGGDWWMKADEALLVGAADSIVIDAESVEAALRFPQFGRSPWP